MGKKVVSVSKTPGHTKHFQTIYLASNVRLCDCPGLVFPATVPKVLQIIGGIYPIAQVSDPYSVVGFLAARLPLVQLLKLKHPNTDGDKDAKFSAMDICEAWALKRGFLTAKAARPDVYRAANHLLRITLDGRICFRMYPPGTKYIVSCHTVKKQSIKCASCRVRNIILLLFVCPLLL